jgi:hypothetical protein
VISECENHDDPFWRTYERLSQEGACDSPGGAEYERVREEWLAAEQPADVEAFIRSRANADADGSEPSWPNRRTRRAYNIVTYAIDAALHVVRNGAPRRLSEIRKAETELTDKEWYNLHGILFEKVDEGRITIVDELDPRNPARQITGSGSVAL